ncbi:hypothetical protein ACFC4S_23190 [Priestia megaterium]|uniref:hypothetical protein n=1 Tax=Priestia megaterium TaxID=1404 RepID=UPI0035E2CE17
MAEKENLYEHCYWMEFETPNTPMEVKVMRSFIQEFYNRPAYEYSFRSADIGEVYSIVDMLEKIRANVSAQLYRSGLVKEVYQPRNTKDADVVEITRLHSYYLYGHNPEDFE